MQMKYMTDFSSSRYAEVLRFIYLNFVLYNEMLLHW